MSRMSLLLLPSISLALTSIATAQNKPAVQRATFETNNGELTVPEDATPEQIVGFLKRASKPIRRRFASRDEMTRFCRRVAKAKVHAANRLSNIGRQDSDLVIVVQAKTDGLNTLGQLGDHEAEAEVTQFLQEMSHHQSLQVAIAARRLQVQRSLANWRTLNDNQKQKALEFITSLVDSQAISVEDVRLAANAAEPDRDARQ